MGAKESVEDLGPHPGTSETMFHTSGGSDRLFFTTEYKPTLFLSETQTRLINLFLTVRFLAYRRNSGAYCINTASRSDSKSPDIYGLPAAPSGQEATNHRSRIYVTRGLQQEQLGKPAPASTPEASGTAGGKHWWVTLLIHGIHCLTFRYSRVS